MSPLIEFLGRARRRIERRRALVWFVHGAAVAAVGSFLVQLSARRWLASGSVWVWLLAFGGLGALVAAVGWLSARPSLFQVARVADQSLGGQERLATALELVDRTDEDGHLLVRRQKADTLAWIGTADPDAVEKRRLPRPALGLASAATLCSLLLVVLPNPAQARARAGQQAEAGRELAADRIAQEATAAAQGVPGEDESRRQELVRELRRVEEAVREADSTTEAVAELSRAQESLRSLAGSTSSGRRSAAAGAGAATAQAAPAAAAGAALAEAGDPAGDRLAEIAEMLPTLANEEQAALAKELAKAANAAADPSAAAGLGQAAEQLAGGDAEAAQRSLEAVARRQDEQLAASAAAELPALAQALPTLDLMQQAELARALRQAATAAAADPRLAESLTKASEAIQLGRPAEAAAALEAAGQRAEQLGPESALDGAAAGASNEVKAVKESLLAGSQAGSAQAQKAGQGKGQGQGAEPGEGQGEGQGQGQGPDAGKGQAQAPGQGLTGSGSGQGKGKGSGSGKGEGQTSGGTPGEGQGSGQGQSAGGGSQRGGGAVTGGAAGSLQGPPGQPSEQVYVPGLSNQGRTQALPGEGGGNGTDSALVPYESVYGEYRSEALSQANRQLIPERLQELLRQYFQETPP